MSRGNFVIKILMIFKFLNSSSIQVPPKLQRCQLWYVLGSDELGATFPRAALFFLDLASGSKALGNLLSNLQRSLLASSC